MKKYIIFLAVAALVFTLASCNRDKPPVTDAPVTTGILPDPVITSDVVPATSAPDTTVPDTTVPDVTTDAPVTTEEPVTTPAPADTTEVVQQPHSPGRALGEGYVISNSGTKLNLLLNWSAVDGEKEGTAVVTVKVYLECYSIFVGERNDGELSVDGTRINYSTPQLEIPGSGFNEIDFGTYTFTVNKSTGATTTLPVYATWHFRGVYAGLSVDYVTIDSNITFDN